MRYLAWFGLLMLVVTSWGIVFGSLDFWATPAASGFVARATTGTLSAAVIWKAWTGRWTP
jgi:hypothetical protein